MFPIGDENIRGRGLAFVTLVVIGINVLVFFLLQADNEAFTYAYSAVPYEITTGRDIAEPIPIEIDGQRDVLRHAPGPEPIQFTLISSMFMHGGLLHLGGNMLFLWVFGDNVEHRMGRLPYIGFYLLAGVIAAMAQVLLDPRSIIPTLGASGAISGVLGAYLVLFPQNRVTVFLFRFLMPVPAVVAIGMWAVFQFINGFGQIFTSQETTGGVAYMAHIGGFVAGLVAGFIFRGIGGGPRPSYRTAY